ncbi:MAG: helix-turn-helix domain-containing protein [Candidatus Odinarchaeota archaeon]
MSSDKQIFTNISEDRFKDLIREVVRDEITRLNHTEAEDLIKAKEACEYLKVSKVTLYKWLKQGKIIGYYLGTRLFFKKSELEMALTKKGDV